jgi:hypothetical protein
MIEIKKIKGAEFKVLMENMRLSTFFAFFWNGSNIKAFISERKQKPLKLDGYKLLNIIDMS